MFISERFASCWSVARGSEDGLTYGRTGRREAEGGAARCGCGGEFMAGGCGGRGRSGKGTKKKKMIKRRKDRGKGGKKAAIKELGDDAFVTLHE